MDLEVILMEDIHKVYKTGTTEVQALNGINLRVKEGEFLAIMGPSGSGKSTLMNIIGCLDVPSQGRYLLKGKEIEKMGDEELAFIRNKEIGFVFQNFNLLARTDALANVELPLIYSRVPKKERKIRAYEALKKVGIEERAKHMPSELSGGEQQKVAIARALVTNPSIILADEPTGNLDTKSSEDIMSIFDKLNNEGNTIILVTHEPDIARHAKRLVRLRDGKIIEDKLQ
jgi:putative ABC transport system ATP-binding protein